MSLFNLEERTVKGYNRSTTFTCFKNTTRSCHAAVLWPQLVMLILSRHGFALTTVLAPKDVIKRGTVFLKESKQVNRIHGSQQVEVELHQFYNVKGGICTPRLIE